MYSPLPPKKRPDWKEGGPAVILPSQENVLVRRAHEYQRSVHNVLLGTGHACSLTAGYSRPRRPEDMELGPKHEWLVG